MLAQYRKFKQKLFNIIYQSFNLEELSGLCSYLAIDYDEIKGLIKSVKVFELINYCIRQGSLLDLINAVAEKRPNRESELLEILNFFKLNPPKIPTPTIRELFYKNQIVVIFIVVGVAAFLIGTNIPNSQTSNSTQDQQTTVIVQVPTEEPTRIIPEAKNLYYMFID